MTRKNKGRSVEAVHWIREFITATWAVVSKGLSMEEAYEFTEGSTP